MYIQGPTKTVFSFQSWPKSDLWFRSKRPKSRMLSSNVGSGIPELVYDR